MTMAPVPRDGETLGEVMFRGNVVMKGYLKNKAATEAAFAGGWFHSGDLGVIHPDGYIQLKDRSKDIIISGGENISSIEVEDALYKHPAVQVVAVVAKPDEKWGETPCAFVELKPGANASAEELIAWCRDHLAVLQMPAHHRVRGNPENVDRQDCRNSSCGIWRRGCKVTPAVSGASGNPRVADESKIKAPRSPLARERANECCCCELYRLMDENVLPYARDLVLDVQFFTLEFRNLKVVGGGVGERFVDFAVRAPGAVFRVPQDAIQSPCGLPPCVRFKPDRIILHPNNRKQGYSVLVHTKIPDVAPRAVVHNWRDRRGLVGD